MTIHTIVDVLCYLTAAVAGYVLCLVIMTWRMKSVAPTVPRHDDNSIIWPEPRYSMPIAKVPPIPPRKRHRYYRGPLGGSENVSSLKRLREELVELNKEYQHLVKETTDYIKTKPY